MYRHSRHGMDKLVNLENYLAIHRDSTIEVDVTRSCRLLIPSSDAYLMKLAMEVAEVQETLGRLAAPYHPNLIPALPEDFC
jgi:hypothetical protein